MPKPRIDGTHNPTYMAVCLSPVLNKYNEKNNDNRAELKTKISNGRNMKSSKKLIDTAAKRY